MEPRHAPTLRRQFVTQAQYDAQYRTGVQLTPGLWLDAEGSLHVNVSELLTLVGLADTIEHREAVAAVCLDVIREYHAGPVIRQDLLLD